MPPAFVPLSGGHLFETPDGELFSLTAGFFDDGKSILHI
jgi:hypothetical protein